MSSNEPISAYILDVESNKWEYIASMREARYSHACGIVNHKEVLVAGGKDVNDHVMNSVELFSLGTLEWRDTTSLPERGFGLASLQYGSSMILFGEKIYQFDEASYAWSLRSERLSNRRAEHIIIPITSKSNAALHIS